MNLGYNLIQDIRASNPGYTYRGDSNRDEGRDRVWMSQVLPSASHSGGLGTSDEGGGGKVSALKVPPSNVVDKKYVAN